MVKCIHSFEQEKEPELSGENIRHTQNFPDQDSNPERASCLDRVLTIAPLWRVPRIWIQCMLCIYNIVKINYNRLYGNIDYTK